MDRTGTFKIQHSWLAQQRADQLSSQADQWCCFDAWCRCGNSSQTVLEFPTDAFTPSAWHSAGKQLLPWSSATWRPHGGLNRVMLAYNRHQSRHQSKQPFRWPFQSSTAQPELAMTPDQSIQGMRKKEIKYQRDYIKLEGLWLWTFKGLPMFGFNF